MAGSNAYWFNSLANITDMKNMNRIKSLAVLLFAVVFCVQSNAQDLVILHTNDTHSQITPLTTGEGKGLGGYERREAYINSIIKKYGKKNVLVVDAGDFSQGSPYFSLFKGDVEIELLNALGYDVVCLGNHEFDNGQQELARRIGNAKFQVVCGNYDFTGGPLEGKLKPYTIIKKGGKKIGIIGLLCNIKNVVSSKYLENAKYNNPVKELNKYALELKNTHKCDLIIALSHCGHYGSNENNPGDEYIAAHSENVDIIVGGHSHTKLKDKVVVKNKLGRNVIIVQDGEKGEYVGKLDVWFK